MTQWKLRFVSTFLIVVFIMCLGIAWAQEKEEKEEKEAKLKMKDLPTVVQQTVQEQSKGAKIVGLSKEEDKGQTIYEVEMKVGGHGKDLLIDSKGAVVSIEEEVQLASLPAAVQTAIKSIVGNGKMTKLESLTKGNKLEAYEMLVKKEGKESEIKLDPTTGKILPEEK
jgi:uncharacterized membrane protein YkoI